jgi:Flp pilus assembly protein TadD
LDTFSHFLKNNRIMKQFILVVLVAFGSQIAFAQDPDGAAKQVTKGTALHDKGDFKGAIERYDRALELDKDNADALYEKAYSLTSMGDAKEAINICKKSIKAKGSKNAYGLLGNLYDETNEPKKALKTYNEGIKAYPDDYMLHFNKGITLYNTQQTDEAQQSLQRALFINPNHPGSMSALSQIMYNKGNRIAAVMLLCRFLSVEPEGKRAVKNLAFLKKLMKGNVEKTGDKSVSISLGAVDKKDKENDFTTVELMIAMSDALVLSGDKVEEKKSESEAFADKITKLATNLGAMKEKQNGFFWTFLAPYFIAMEKEKHVSAFAQIVLSSDKNNADWLKAHEKEVEAFAEWSKYFEWSEKK